jgi:hypothetical protein
MGDQRDGGRRIYTCGEFSSNEKGMVVRGCMKQSESIGLSFYLHTPLACIHIALMYIQE